MRYSSCVFVILFSLVAGVSGAFISFFYHPFVDLTLFDCYDTGAYSVLLDDEGEEWARFQIDRREPVNFIDMPKHLVDAFVAAEDHAFWHHNGISIKGIIRSVLVNIYHGRIVQGASTITQQLVKLLFFDSRKTFCRKIKEQLISLYIEQYVSKEYILQTYLNHVYFGCGIYGVEAASQRFWKKTVSELTLDEAATLASIVKSPQHYCPLLYPRTAQQRRNIVLNSMLRLGFISTFAYEEALKKEVVVVSETQEVCAPHAKEAIRMTLEQALGKHKLYTEGLIIQTTLNKNIQLSAQKCFDAQFTSLKKKISPQIDGALLSMEVQTGEIKALIGGCDFKYSKFNRALQMQRQFGSIFKPLVFAVAVEKGFRFDQTDIDEPLEIRAGNSVWKPQNYTRTFDGCITLARALSHSNNIVTIKTLMKVGIDKVIELARKVHISGTLNPYLSLALGCVDGTVKEALGMFNVFANDGVYVEPHLIKWVKDKWGTKVWKHEALTERVLSSAVNSQVAKILSIGMERYRMKNGKEWLSGDVQAIGKTGTTNDNRSCWFCGATPSYVTVLYGGRDDNCSMGESVYPTQTLFPIWLSFNKLLTHIKPYFNYNNIPLKEIIIDDRTGSLLDTFRPRGCVKILVPSN